MMTQSSNDPDRTCSVVAWGDPSAGRTFSGYSRSMVAAMSRRGLLRREFSLKQLRPFDALSGAFNLSLGNRRLRPTVRYAWLWSERASRTLERRLADQLDRAGDYGTFLQVGSLVEIDRRFGRYAVIGDMTIPQAYRARRFAVSRLSRRQYLKAVDVQRRVLHHACHVFALTEWARQSFIKDCGVDPRRVTVVYAGPSSSIPVDVSIPRRPHQILFVGIDWERKGGPSLVEGFRLLRERLPTAELVIVGCSPKVDCPGVRIEGLLPAGDPAAQRRLGSLYQQSACLALMSDFEPLGIVILEAFAVGLPAIVYDTGPQSEIVRDGENGVVVADRQPQTIAAGLFRLLSDSTATQAMGTRARQSINMELNWDCVVTKIASQLAPRSSDGSADAILSDANEADSNRFPAGVSSSRFQQSTR